MEWFTVTLKTYPELAIFLSLCIGYWAGGKSFKGFSLGAVTSTLLAAIVIGQLGVTVSPTVKNIFFLLFLFAVGYGIGPQFVRGIAKDGLPQAGFAVVVCLLCLLFPVGAAIIAGYDLGSAAGLYAGSQTISAAIGLSTDAINRLALPPDQTGKLLSNIPIAYAVTYIFGTIGSAILLSQVLPAVMRINLREACQDYQKRFGGLENSQENTPGWHQYVLRAYEIKDEECGVGKTVAGFESLFPDRKVFVEGMRRDGKIMELGSATVLQKGDILAIGGDHQAIVNSFALPACFVEVEDSELLNQPVAGVDVYVSHKDVNGKTLHSLAEMAGAHGVFLRRIKRGLTGTEIPILPSTQLHRGDVVTLSGLSKDVKRAASGLGVIDKKSTVSDVAFLAGAIFIGGLLGTVVIKAGGLPITLSTAGGALISGLLFGWLRSVHPTYGYIPESTVWFMNSLGLNVFIAVVGLSAGPDFVSGLKELGVSLFLWGMAATSLPLVCAAFIGKYIFKFHPAILFGCCAGARTTTAALGMINERAGSTIPGLGYTVTYAIGNTLLTLWGLAVIMILS